jgi:small-conductance mechanosensitive channel
VGVASRLVHYVIVITGFGIALHTMGINLTALFAAGALFAVAVGFAMQNLTANFVSGVILLAERVIKPGDVLEIERQMVRVRDMGIRATVARTLNDEDLVIPNSVIVQSTVRNYSFRDMLYRLRVPVGVSYGSDLTTVRETLETMARELDWRSPKKDSAVLLTDFGSSSVDFEVSVWIEDPWNSRRGRSDLREAIWWSLKEAGVTIAFPQVDVHFDPPFVDSLQGLRRAVY